MKQDELVKGCSYLYISLFLVLSVSLTTTDKFIKFHKFINHYESNTLQKLK